MKKKLLLIVFTLLIGFVFSLNVKADTECKYVGNNKNGTLTVRYTIKDNGNLVGGECFVDGYAVSSDETYIENDDELIDNWKKKYYSESQTGKDYYQKTGKCLPYAIWSDESGHFNVFVSNKKDLGIFLNKVRDEQGHQVLTLLNQKLLNKKYKIHFVKNLETAEGTMNTIDAVYGENLYIPEAGFKLYGYSVVGYRIYNNGKWKCKNDGKYHTQCKDDSDYETVGSDTIAMIEFDPSDPNIYLYAQWRLNANISSQTINKYFQGEEAEKFCEGRGFIWNESNGGYCNTDNLQYVTCGDSYDIPIQVPKLISYCVNILKIATPIILIVVGMITLLKALVASKEDELKKAQASLIKKIIASVMVFFVVSIVQFVILKVANKSETASISDCMSCFLNNDCYSTTYYKTNIGGNYFCTLISETGREDLKSCVSFYEEQRELFND